jgi:hypothetical protein
MDCDQPITVAHPRSASYFSVPYDFKRVLTVSRGWVFCLVLFEKSLAGVSRTVTTRPDAPIRGTPFVNRKARIYRHAMPSEDISDRPSVAKFECGRCFAACAYRFPAQQHAAVAVAQPHRLPQCTRRRCYAAVPPRLSRCFVGVMLHSGRPSVPNRACSYDAKRGLIYSNHSDTS